MSWFLLSLMFLLSLIFLGESFLDISFYFVIHTWLLLQKGNPNLLERKRKLRANIIHSFLKISKTFSLYSPVLVPKLNIILGLHLVSNYVWVFFYFSLNEIPVSSVFCIYIWYQNFILTWRCFCYFIVTCKWFDLFLP